MPIGEITTYKRTYRYLIAESLKSALDRSLDVPLVDHAGMDIVDVTLAVDHDGTGQCLSLEIQERVVGEQEVGQLLE